MPGIVVYRTPWIDGVGTFRPEFIANQRNGRRIPSGIEQLDYRNATGGLWFPNQLYSHDHSGIVVAEVRNINNQLTTQVDPTVTRVAIGVGRKLPASGVG